MGMLTSLPFFNIILVQSKRRHALKRHTTEPHWNCEKFHARSWIDEVTTHVTNTDLLHAHCVTCDTYTSRVMMIWPHCSSKYVWLGFQCPCINRDKRYSHMHYSLLLDKSFVQIYLNPRSQTTGLGSFINVLYFSSLLVCVYPTSQFQVIKLKN